MLGVGLLATVVVTVSITRLARRKLREQMDEPIAEEAAPVTEEEVQRTAQQGASLRSTIVLAVAALVMVGAASTLVANSKSFDHSKLDALLREYVDDDGWVDYRG